MPHRKLKKAAKRAAAKTVKKVAKKIASKGPVIIIAATRGKKPTKKGGKRKTA